MKNEHDIITLYDDAQMYDDQNINVTEDLPFWSKIASLYGDKNKPIIELGAGTGRVSLNLADLGFWIQGIDLSQKMIDLAKQKSLDITNPDAGKIEFIRGDVRTYQPGSKVPLVIFPYNSLSHMITNQDIDSCLTNIHSMLEPGGRFVFSVFVPLPKFLVREPDALYTLDSFKDSKSNKMVEVYESMNYDTWSQINDITWFFYKDGTDEPCIQRLSLRMFYPQETEYILRTNGFEVEHRYGDFDFSPIESNSVVQGIVARKVGL